jgi:hypothetical protein
MVLLTLRWHALTKVLPFLVVPTTDACKPLSFDSEIRTDGCCVEFCASLTFSSTWQPTRFWFLRLSFEPIGEGRVQLSCISD